MRRFLKLETNGEKIFEVRSEEKEKIFAVRNEEKEKSK